MQEACTKAESTKKASISLRNLSTRPDASERTSTPDGMRATSTASE